MTTTRDDVHKLMTTAIDWSRFGLETMLDAQRECLRLGAAQAANAVTLAREGIGWYEKAAEQAHADGQATLAKAQDGFRSVTERVTAVAD